MVAMSVMHSRVVRRAFTAIFEVRTIEGNDIVRILYFFDNGKIIIATNGFVKKQKKTPKSEIDLAKKRRKDYYNGKEAGTYE